MAGYVGKPLVEPVLDYGPPTYSVEMEDNTHAFVWAMSDETTIPGHATTTGNVYGSSVYTHTTLTPAQTITTDCNYVLYAKATTKKPEGPKDWLVTGFRKPTFDCE